jgi:hypothetical protein
MKTKRLCIARWVAALGVFCVTCVAVAAQTGGTAPTPNATAPGQQTQKSPQSPRPRIRYSIKQSGETDFGPSTLLATFNGKTSVVIPKSEKKCLAIKEQRDFDGDGLTDALVENITACGGNCCPNQFFFVSARPDGTFAVGDELADSWKDPVIEKWKGKWSVVIVSNNEGVNTERPVEYTRRFVLQDGKGVKVEEHKRPDMKAIVEMRSEIFKSDDPGETHSIQYDLDGDGKKDTITGRLWERWGRILWTVEFADGKKFSSNDACKRIGVLPTKTDGVHDLVCDQDTVLHWNGTEYKE